MGLCGTKVDGAAAARYVEGLRVENVQRNPLADVLLLGIREQAYSSRLFLTGAACAVDDALVAGVSSAVASSGSSLVKGANANDELWDLAWQGASLTTGPSAFSRRRPAYFPHGRSLVRVFDALAQHGWTPSAAASFGGPSVGQAAADWPVVVFSRESELYTWETLFFAAQEQPDGKGSLCAAGPERVILALRESLTERLQAACETGAGAPGGAEQWDAVWHGVAVTSGSQDGSAQQSFPQGGTIIAILEEVYKLGWRLVAAPSFGGAGGPRWPCLVFRCLSKLPAAPPALLVGALGPQLEERKVCLAGAGAEAASRALAEALGKVRDNHKVWIGKDGHDVEWDRVLRETQVTVGASAFGAELSHFPRGDAVMKILSVMNDLGWSLAACPNFGGPGASWPAFVWERRGERVQSAFVAIQEQAVSGKVCIAGGGDLRNDDDLHERLVAGFRAVAGGVVENKQDSFDESFDICFRGTRMTSGPAAFAALQGGHFWPFGFSLEVLVSELGGRGWRVAGAPSFGSGSLPWTSLVFEKTDGNPKRFAGLACLSCVRA